MIDRDAIAQKREQIAEALHDHDHIHTWRSDHCDDACGIAAFKRADIVIALFSATSTDGRAERSECAYPSRNSGDGRGCEMDDCPRHGSGHTAGQLDREEIAARVEADDEVSPAEYISTIAEWSVEPGALMYAAGYMASMVSGNERLDVLAAVRDYLDRDQALR